MCSTFKPSYQEHSAVEAWHRRVAAGTRRHGAPAIDRYHTATHAVPKTESTL